MAASVRRPTAAGLTDAFRRAQLGVQARALKRLVGLWALFDADDIAASWTALEAPIIDAIQGGYAQSAELGAAYYSAFRELRSVPGDPTPVLAAAKPAEQLADWLEVAPRWAGAMTARGLPDVADRTLVVTAGTVSRNVLDGGRDTITGSVEADPRALGYVRVTGPRPCAFCAILCSRGPVYKSERTARYRAGGEERRYHAHCQCLPAPVYGESDAWPGRAREFRQMWDRAEGETNDDKMNAFRRELERPHLHGPDAGEAEAPV